MADAYKSFLTFKNISDLIGPLIVLQFIVLLISVHIYPPPFIFIIKIRLFADSISQVHLSSDPTKLKNKSKNNNV